MTRPDRTTRDGSNNRRLKPAARREPKSMNTKRAETASMAGLVPTEAETKNLVEEISRYIQQQGARNCARSHGQGRLAQFTDFGNGRVSVGWLTDSHGRPKGEILRNRDGNIMHRVNGQEAENNPLESRRYLVNDAQKELMQDILRDAAKHFGGDRLILVCVHNELNRELMQTVENAAKEALTMMHMGVLGPDPEPETCIEDLDRVVKAMITAHCLDEGTVKRCEQQTREQGRMEWRIQDYNRMTGT